MPGFSIICGVILIAIGVAGYVYGVVSSPPASMTALIPAFIGLIMAVLGFLAARVEGLRKHLMHVAVVIALLGFIATAVRVLPKIGELTASPAVLSQAATALVCLAFVLMAIRSFAAARMRPEA